MLAEKIESVLKTWSQHIGSGGLPRRIFAIGRDRLRDTARQVRNLQEGPADRLDTIVARWDDQARKGIDPDLVSFVMACRAVRLIAEEVRSIEERSLVPVDADGEIDMEAIRAHFADVLDPDTRAARLRD